MDPTQSFISEFKGFVEDLTTPEKRNIVALTEIAREALNTQPQAAPGLATVIVDRIIEVCLYNYDLCMVRWGDVTCS